jgi:cobalt/nickel transport system permease protein
MAGGHHSPSHDHLHVPGASPVHRMAPEATLLGTVAYVVAVALTPRTAPIATAVQALVLAAVVRVAGLPPRLVVARLAAVVPFVAFAVVVPFVAGGEQVEVAGVSLSVDGLWAAWGIMSKALLGAGASIVLAATTPVPDLLRGMARLHVPSVLVAVIGSMFRYLDLCTDQLRRMRTAMVARGHDPRWLWQVRPIATSAGTLFVRSYERGERVHSAMLARGFDGSVPDLGGLTASGRVLLLALVPGSVAAAATLIAVLG